MTTFYIVKGRLFIGTSPTNATEISDPSVEKLVEMKVPEVQAHGLYSYLQQSSQVLPDPDEYKNKSQVLPVPDEYKNKYCLLFGGQVCYSYDSKEEMEHGKNVHCHLAFTEYHPRLT